jgi:hypothetical protein
MAEYSDGVVTESNVDTLEIEEERLGYFVIGAYVMFIAS